MKNFNGKKKRAPLRKFKPKSTKVTKPIKNYVKKEIARQAENKQADIVAGYQIGPYSGTFWNTTGIIPITPYDGFITILQGTGQNNRIGNQVRTRKVILRGVLFPNIFNATSNPSPKPMEIKFFFGHHKISSTILPQSASFNAFYQNGSGSSTFTNNLLDLLKPINKDTWTVKKTFTYKIGYADANSSTGVNYISNNDFKLNRKFSIDLTKYCPKVLKWNDNATTPTTNGLFWWIQVVYADGTSTTGSPAINQLAQIQYSLSYIFEDP